MREFLEKAGCHVARGIFIPERLTAARAGIVTYGKNCFAMGTIGDPAFIPALAQALKDPEELVL